ncbi:hypothetical protein AVEN_43763-1 [Araneus ventricosus]|uniref:Uncharacterized protein n=1 Tax=Araneus ventricosus TaxID=182803 RepID=A0A4Y2R3I8_ARAVE|nr:hypothetical protein AVEN_43763-1 [Araneus ventricosus]
MSEPARNHRLVVAAFDFNTIKCSRSSNYIMISHHMSWACVEEGIPKGIKLQPTSVVTDHWWLSPPPHTPKTTTMRFCSTPTESSYAVHLQLIRSRSVDPQVPNSTLFYKPTVITMK